MENNENKTIISFETITDRVLFTKKITLVVPAVSWKQKVIYIKSLHKKRQKLIFFRREVGLESWGID